MYDKINRPLPSPHKKHLKVCVISNYSGALYSVTVGKVCKNKTCRKEQEMPNLDECNSTEILPEPSKKIKISFQLFQGFIFI